MLSILAKKLSIDEMVVKWKGRSKYKMCNLVQVTTYMLIDATLRIVLLRTFPQKIPITLEAYYCK